MKEFFLVVTFERMGRRKGGWTGDQEGLSVIIKQI